MDIEDLVAVQIMNDLEDAEEQLENAVERRILVKTDAFTLTDEQFISLFRLPKQLVEYVITILTPLLVNPNRASALTVQTKVRLFHLR